MARLSAPDAVFISDSRGWRNKGARACTAAHRLAWREGRRRGADPVLVFEDDVVLCSGFRERLEALELPEDWAICYFGCVFHRLPEVISPGLLRIRGATWDMHAYLIRPDLAREVSRELARISTERYARNTRDRTASDVVLATYHGRYPAYSVWPPMAWQTYGLSNNENAIRGNYTSDGRQIPHPEVAAELDRVHGLTAMKWEHPFAKNRIKKV